nr:NfeD family protein [uncultured Anaerostipes sp.]
MFAIYWMGAAVILLLIEILTLGLTSIWFAGGAVLAAVTAFVGGPLLLQLAVFIAVSCLLFFFTRPLAQKYLNSSVEKTNVEALIGQHGIVRETIDNFQGKGKVYVNGMDWSAKSLHDEEIPEGTEIVIHKIQGVKLIVDAIPVPKSRTENEIHVVPDEPETPDIWKQEEPEIWREAEEEEEAWMPGIWDEEEEADHLEEEETPELQAEEEEESEAPEEERQQKEAGEEIPEETEDIEAEDTDIGKSKKEKEE